MTGEEHRKRHVELHVAVDELLADYLRHNPKTTPSKTGVLDLLTWSYEQCNAPSGNHTPHPLDREGGSRVGPTFGRIAVEYFANLRKRTEP